MRHFSTGVLVAAVLVAGAVAARAGDGLQALLDPYFRIHAALSDDRTDGVKADALAIAKAARAMGEPGTTIAQAADTLAASADLAATRVAFGALSDAVIALADKTRAAGDDVHTMFCPMASKQWLQKTEAVSNPYYGKAMLACGEKKKKT